MCRRVCIVTCLAARLGHVAAAVARETLIFSSRVGRGFWVLAGVSGRMDHGC